MKAGEGSNDSVWLVAMDFRELRSTRKTNGPSKWMLLSRPDYAALPVTHRRALSGPVRFAGVRWRETLCGKGASRVAPPY